jgi:hypothetical protein
METANRPCPNCNRNAISVSSLIVSDAVCRHCRQQIGVHWAFRAVFFVLTFAAAAATGLIVYVDQGFYAALLFISVPIGVLGYVKARVSPLVVRRPRDPNSPDGIDSRLPND